MDTDQTAAGKQSSFISRPAFLLVALLAVTIILLLSVSSCTKTVEKVFTPKSDCASLLEKQNPDDFRDEYDSCVLFAQDELSDPAICLGRCQKHCEQQEMSFSDTLTDFTGCHCYCTLRIRMQAEVIREFVFG